jgi:hypothetical protein
MLVFLIHSVVTECVVLTADCVLCAEWDLYCTAVSDCTGEIEGKKWEGQIKNLYILVTWVTAKIKIVYGKLAPQRNNVAVSCVPAAELQS